MPTVEMKFGPAAMKLAIAESDGRHPSSAPLVLRDPAETGLTIRVSGRTAAWTLKWNGRFKKLADVGNPDTKPDRRESGCVYTARDAAELAGRVRELMKLDLDPSDYIAARALGHDHESALRAGASVTAMRAGAWDWSTLAERFIVDHIAEATVTAKGRVRPASAKSEKDVRSTLLHTDVVAAYGRKLARDLSKGDVEAVRNAWQKAGRKSAQRKLIVYTKAAMRWAKEHHSEAHLCDVAPWWVELRHKRYATEAQLAEVEGTASPGPLSAAQVARVLLIAEQNRVAPGRAQRRETGEVVLAALWWIALSAQRTHAAYAVRPARIEDRVDTDGWYEVAWVPSDVKSKRHFTLAVPPRMFDVTLRRALIAGSRREDSVWAFPSAKLKRRGIEGAVDMQVSDTVLNSLLNRLRGKDAYGGPDLLAAAGIPHFTLHELRDALTTHLASLPDMPSSTASAILDHEPAGEDPQSREAAVTREHYNKSQRLALKARGLTVWSDAVLDEYDRIHAEWQREIKANLLRNGGPKPPSAAARRRASRQLDHAQPTPEVEAPPRPARVSLALGKLGARDGTDDNGSEDDLGSEG